MLWQPSALGPTTLFWISCSRAIAAPLCFLPLSSSTYTSIRRSLTSRAVTQDNHTATQSTFASPCIPAHDTNITINGFDSSFRDTVNGTAITTLAVPITDNTTTIWFFDFNTCAEGGVGGINVNESSTATLDGFRVRVFPCFCPCPCLGSVGAAER